MSEVKNQQRHIARDISYADSAETKGGRALIRLIENTTGRLRLIRRADGYEKEVAKGRDFWSVITERYGLTLDVVGGSLDRIPREGPLVLIANHPYGILDGLMMGHILSQSRGDFRILANHVFRKAEDLNKVILPVAFDETREAVQLNLATRKNLWIISRAGGNWNLPRWNCEHGGATVLVSYGPGVAGFTARMISKSNATVVPVYFDGHTSRMFQIASHLHANLRVGLLMKEFRNRIDTPVRVVIGDPIGRGQLDPLAKNSKAMMDFLRKATYELSPTPLKSYDYGFEFEERHRAG